MHSGSSHSAHSEAWALRSWHIEIELIVRTFVTTANISSFWSEDVQGHCWFQICSAAELALQLLSRISHYPHETNQTFTTLNPKSTFKLKDFKVKRDDSEGKNTGGIHITTCLGCADSLACKKAWWSQWRINTIGASSSCIPWNTRSKRNEWKRYR
jgi:hypothetical protein